jgi:methanogenic corrinoid protein MtbC1
MEHYATAVTQMLMSRLTPLARPERIGRTMVASCVREELHDLGIRMVADFFEMDGWDVHYLGANVPTRAIVERTAAVGADLVALSATMTFHVEKIAEVVAALHADKATRHVKVIVGGYLFSLAPDLWKRIGADGCATDATTALALGHRLTDLLAPPRAAA